MKISLFTESVEVFDFTPEDILFIEVENMKKSVMTYGQEIREIYSVDSLFIILKSSANKAYEFGGNVFDRFGARILSELALNIKLSEYSFPWKGPDEGANEYMTID